MHHGAVTPEIAAGLLALKQRIAALTAHGLQILKPLVQLKVGRREQRLPASDKWASEQVSLELARTDYRLSVETEFRGLSRYQTGVW